MNAFRGLLLLSLLALVSCQDGMTIKGVPSQGAYIKTSWMPGEGFGVNPLINITSNAQQGLKVYCTGQGLTEISVLNISECYSVYVVYRGKNGEDSTNETVTLASQDPPRITLRYNVPVQINTPTILDWAYDGNNVNITVLTPLGRIVTGFNRILKANVLGEYTLGNQTIHRVVNPGDVLKFDKAAQGQFLIQGKNHTAPRVLIKTDAFVMKHIDSGVYKVGRPGEWTYGWGDFIQDFWPNMPLGQWLVLGVSYDYDNLYTANIGHTSGSYTTSCQYDDVLNATWAWAGMTSEEFRCMKYAGVTGMTQSCDELRYDMLINCNYLTSASFSATNIPAIRAKAGANLYPAGSFVLYNTTIPKGQFMFLPLDSFSIPNGDMSMAHDTFSADDKEYHAQVIVDGRTAKGNQNKAWFTLTSWVKVDTKYSIKIPSKGVAAIKITPPNNTTCLVLHAKKKDFKIRYAYDPTGQFNARWIDDDNFIVCEATRLSIRSFKEILSAEIKLDTVPMITASFDKSFNIPQTNASIYVVRFPNMESNRVITIQTSPADALMFTTGNSHNKDHPLHKSKNGQRYNFCERESIFVLKGKDIKVKGTVVADPYYHFGCV